MVDATAPPYAAHGRHLLLTLEGCEPAMLDDLVALEVLVRRAAEATGATVLRQIVHGFAPQGVTALALLAESHASLHTYPEHGAAFWDCFTCGDACDPQRSVAVLVEALRPRHIQRQLVERRLALP
ncbi:adenosylmethionine decarboxylase [Chloroflexia bacterium SDU3-3]|nr:adenosylmethionine decarboxylase [Chloroflexia bacterium SDU3-3]